MITIIVLFTPHLPEKKPPPEKPPEAVKKKLYRIAIIIDDVGYPSSNFQAYMKFSEKLTFSVLPFLDNSSLYARKLHESGFEIMLHIPMEPLSYPSSNPGLYALFTGDSRMQVRTKLDLMIEQNPYAVGANNHMGSKATLDRELMYHTLSYLKKKNYYFIDSVTTRHSCAYQTALDLGLTASSRDVFLDNRDEFSYINSQFTRLKTLARNNGTAIGIGHFNRINTIKVLKYQLPLLKKQNFVLVFASEAVPN
ncbi:MAG: divergent polysaccharide deacetylase family protein [Spirochaetota bacterium]